MAATSYMEDVVAEATRWLEEMPQQIADALKVNGRSPFGAPATDAEKLAFYQAVFFRRLDTPAEYRGPDFVPDGLPNDYGRAIELKRIGIDAYVRTLARLTKNAADQVQLRATQEPGGPPNVREQLLEKS
jgi:hypothetical protein